MERQKQTPPCGVTVYYAIDLEDRLNVIFSENFLWRTRCHYPASLHKEHYFKRKYGEHEVYED